MVSQQHLTAYEHLQHTCHHSTKKNWRSVDWQHCQPAGAPQKKDYINEFKHMHTLSYTVPLFLFSANSLCPPCLCITQLYNNGNHMLISNDIIRISCNSATGIYSDPITRSYKVISQELKVARKSSCILWTSSAQGRGEGSKERTSLFQPVHRNSRLN